MLVFYGLVVWYYVFILKKREILEKLENLSKFEHRYVCNIYYF